MRKIYIDIAVHLIFSIIFSAVIFIKTNTAIYACIFILGGVFIDLDHFVDHFIFFKNRFKLSDFLDSEYLKSRKAYLFLHSWEIILIVLIFAVKIKSFGLLLVFFSASLHLAIDNIQRKNLLAYFLFYRAYNKFNAAVIFPEFKGKFY